MSNVRIALGALCIALTGCASGEILEPGGASFGGPVGETDDEGVDGSTGGEDSSGPGAEATSASGGGDSGADDDPSGSEGGDDSSCVPEAEVCDGTDNDCNGIVDDDPVDAGAACDTGMPGACASGTRVCENGFLQCAPELMPTDEVCDGVDNDCNGQIDDGNPGGGAGCDTGMPGVCAAGTTDCHDGDIVCVANQTASPEVCDGQDNDCNGVVDDGNPGGGGACNTGLQGVCAAGTMTCQGGTLQCVQNQQAGPEICGDGLDNDCNGVVDDGCGCSHPICQSGAALVDGCDPCVTQICNVDPYCCNTSWDGICVGQVSSVCGLVCQGSCSHSPCVTGVALVSGCDPGGCVTQICNVDPYCCSTSWDGLCVSEVDSVCGLSC